MALNLPLIVQFSWILILSMVKASSTEINGTEFISDHQISNQNETFYVGEDMPFSRSNNTTSLLVLRNKTDVFIYEVLINDTLIAQGRELVFQHHNTTESHVVATESNEFYSTGPNSSLAGIELVAENPGLGTEIPTSKAIHQNGLKWKNVGRLKGNGSSLVNAPWEDTPSLLELHPQEEGKNGTITFLANDSNSWNPYVEQMTEFLENYSKEAQQKNVHCDFEHLHANDQACQFDLVYLGPSCTKQNNFGYSIGKPCVLLSPRNVANWVPEPYNNETLNTPAVPDEVRRLMRIFNNRLMFVTCEGESDADRANIGPLAYLPPFQGFPSYFFPNRKDTIESYVAPIMAVEFLNPTNASVINIICHAWAGNVGDVPFNSKMRFSLKVN